MYYFDIFLLYLAFKELNLQICYVYRLYNLIYYRKVEKQTKKNPITSKLVEYYLLFVFILRSQFIVVVEVLALTFGFRPRIGRLDFGHWRNIPVHLLQSFCMCEDISLSLSSVSVYLSRLLTGVFLKKIFFYICPTFFFSSICLMVERVAISLCILWP